MSKIKYQEPTEFFPKELRKKYGLGEYAKTDSPKNKAEDKKKK